MSVTGTTSATGLVEAGGGTDVAARNALTVSGQPTGRVLVFAHGFGCDQSMWSRVARSFADDHRLVLFDHVGAGGSDLSAYDPVKYSSLQGYVDDLIEICDSQGLRDVVLVAHSVSTMMAVVAAAQRPDLFGALVLVAPSPCYIDDDGYVGGFSRGDIDELLVSLESNYFAWAAAMAPMVMGNPDLPELGAELEGSFCRTDPATARAFARVTFLSDVRPVLGAVRTPSLILQCSDDALAPDEVGRYMHQRLAGSSLRRLTATGHCPHVSAPQETAAAIRQFLQDG